MASQKTLKLYVYVDGVNDVPFYGSDAGVYEEFITLNGENFITSDGFVFNVRNVNEQVEIGSFRYDAKRMGSAPTLTFTLMYPECLDAFWNDDVYALFNGERHFLKQTPTSSKNNDDNRYKHEVELIAERRILEDTYFYDAVVGDPQANDRPVTNSTKFFFYGNLEQFAQRMNASLQYTKLQKVNEDETIDGYHIVIDPEISTGEKQIAFDEAFFFQALQESYNTFGIPFYFVGKEIHLGFTNNVIDETIEYGADNALLSVTKTNANFKLVNRASGYGSTENIPYYYPNNSPKGEIEAEVVTTSNDFSVSIEDHEKYSNEISLDATLHYQGEQYTIISGKESLNENRRREANLPNYTYTDSVHLVVNAPNKTSFDISPYGTLVSIEEGTTASTVELDKSNVQTSLFVTLYEDGDKWYQKKIGERMLVEDAGSFFVELPKAGRYRIELSFQFVHPYYRDLKNTIYVTTNINCFLSDGSGWRLDGKKVDLGDIGLSYSGQPNIGDTITQRLVKRTKVSDTLQPSIYRATDGAERFYNAINYPFTPEEGYVLQYAEYIGEDGLVHNDLYKKDNGEYLVFVNPYVEGHPKEHVFSVEDIKPTIEEMTNNILAYTEEDDDGNVTNIYQRIDMFSEFAYDRDDNDETYIDDNGNIAFKHPYFFGKLRKLNFNLFECAIEDQPMAISMTSGHCGACTFEIGVSEEYPNQNPVQIDENGNLVYDGDGRVLCGLEDFQPLVRPQDEQQDTENYEVWIALKKEESTYGILMPKAPKYEDETLIESGHRPKSCTSANANDGDTFVIIGIKLPDEYIEFAERKLEKKIIQYITENNNEKFNFSVNFSRIFLEENEDILNNINENARFTLRYNGNDYLVYVSSFSYSFSEGDILPNITVELDNTLTIAQGVLQQAIDSVKSDVAKAINGIDVAAIGSRFFLRKDTDDIADGVIGFRKGVIFGNGGDVTVNSDGSAKLTIDYLEVTKKATFTSLEIQERNHVGGQILITPASMVCSNVEEYDGYYRCYMETQGEGGEEIFNTFAVDDQAICQTFNAWGSKYYWRLVVGIGDNYIDLSKVDGEYDEESDAPSVGDKIIQLGNRSNTARQAAQVLSSHGEDSPSFIMYNGINSFSLDGKEVTGILWNPETQEPQMYSYGSFFFGDRTTDENGNLLGDFITFQKKKGETEKTLHINANVTIGEDSSGLTNLSEWAEKQEQLDTASSTASFASESVGALQQDFSDAVARYDQSLIEINEKLDGVVESFFDDYTPTRTNEPAATWITEGTEADHVGDTFTNTALEGDDAGKSWRWLLQDDETYNWQQIADSDAAKALALAGQAQTTANGKSTTFLVKPNRAYGIGDMWIVRDDYIPNGYRVGDILTSSSESSTYVESHWSKVIRYTDDTKANEVDQRITDDFDYLRETFGKTVDVDGVLMSKMVAVKNSLEQVEAFLNGSEYYSDSTHGKLILAGGIPETSESGSTDLEDRAKEAATRIYEDGTTYTNKMVLDDGCSIGDDLNITAYTDTEGVRKATIKAGIAASYDNNFTVTKYVGLNEQGIRTEGLSNRGTEEVIMMGDFCAGYAMKISVGSESAFRCNDYGKDVGLFVDVADGYSILSPQGMFAGLRPKIRVITTPNTTSRPYELNEFDHTIVIHYSTEGANFYLKLPDEPQEGQEYVIMTTDQDTRVIINTIKTVYNVTDGETTEQPTFTGTARKKINFVYSSGSGEGYWYLVYEYYS